MTLNVRIGREQSEITSIWALRGNPLGPGLAVCVRGQGTMALYPHSCA
jgi:hypothetical protein